MNIGPTELVIILVIALIVFGPRKLPDLGKSLGQAMAQFRRASDDFKRSWEQEVEMEKSKLSEIKHDIESPTVSEGYQTADNYDSNYDSGGGETHPADEPAAAEPEPAGASVAHSNEPKKSEHWI